MPQMAPIMWMGLMVLFLLSMLMFMIKTYFMKKSLMESNFKKSIKNKQLNWKW